MKHTALHAAQDRGLANTTEEVREKLHKALSIIESIPVELTTPLAATAPVTEDYVRAVIRARRQRTRYFDADLFADPAWDILLDLYTAELAQRRLTVSSLCIAAAVPATTALRWIGTLENRGLLRRQNDPLDGRRVYVSLTNDAVQALSSYFTDIGAGKQTI